MQKNGKKETKPEQEARYHPSKHLRIVDDPLAYEIRKMQIAIRVIDRLMIDAPEKVKWADYGEMLSKHTELMTRFKKQRGIKNEESLDSKGMEKATRKGAFEVGEKNPFSMDS